MISIRFSFRSSFSMPPKNSVSNFQFLRIYLERTVGLLSFVYSEFFKQTASRNDDRYRDLLSKKTNILREEPKKPSRSDTGAVKDTLELWHVGHRPKSNKNDVFFPFKN